MITNENMKPNRFLRMFENKTLYNKIAHEIGKGLSIQVTTYTRSTVYKSLDSFKLGKNGVYVKRGKNWDCINGASIRSVRM